MFTSAIAKAVDEWKRNKEENKDQDLPEEENIYPEDVRDYFIYLFNNDTQTCLQPLFWNQRKIVIKNVLSHTCIYNLSRIIALRYIDRAIDRL